MKLFKFVFLIFLTLILTLLLFAQENGSKIMQKADFVLIPRIATYNLKLIDKIEGQDDKINKFKCFKKSDLKYLFFAVFPKTIYGQASLRIDNTIWTYYPLADKMVKESYKSAFLGTGLSYIDVMYNELVNYYEVSIIDSNYKYNDKNWNKYLPGIKEKPLCYKLLLKAKKGASGYPKAIIYIDKTNFLTIKREYYSLSDEKVKEIYFNNFIFDNQKHITDFSMEVIDLLGQQVITLAYFTKIQVLNSLSDKYFSINFIKTYTPEDDEK